MGPFKFIINVGFRIRNPLLQKKIAFLNESKNWDLDQLVGLKIKRLNEL